MYSSGPVTQILADVANGRDSAVQQLLPLVYEELRRLARSHLRRERPDHTLEPTALVHEAFLRMVGPDVAQPKDRAHFFAVAATAMRQILIDHARRRGAQKRGGEFARIDLDLAQPAEHREPVLVGGADVLALEAALQKLSERDPRKARVVELRVFGGMTCDQTAEVLGVATKTAEADWYMARAWLRRELSTDAE